jgi:hypothetical protein
VNPARKASRPITALPGGGRGRRRPGVDKLLRPWLDAKIEAFQAACAQQRHVARQCENDLIARLIAGDANHRGATPTLQNGPVRLTKAPLFVPLDAERLQNPDGRPRQLGAGIYEHHAKRS